MTDAGAQAENAGPASGGRRSNVVLAGLSDDDRPELAELDWQRSLNPVMAGWMLRPQAGAGVETITIRSVGDGELVGVIDVAPLPGYPGVTSLSMYTDTTRARGGWALEAYSECVTQILAGSTHLIHHEVLGLNGPILRIMRAAQVQPTARMRDHAYVAGRFWDVLIYSYDAAHWDHLLRVVAPRIPVARPVPNGS